MVNRFDVSFVDLNPSIGSEINIIRPTVIVSPNEMNNALNTVIIAPLTSTIRNYPTRVNCVVAGKDGQIALDQILAVDKARLKSKIDILNTNTEEELVSKLIEMFS